MGKVRRARYRRWEMIECEGITGQQAEPYLENLAELRCQIFREFPYLYDGDVEAEHKYLNNYTDNPNVFLVIAKDGERVVGVSTCMAMQTADEAFQKPFLESGIPIGKICYLGESVLLPEFRGMGVGHRFFDSREKWARERNFEVTAFCAVVREADHPEKPSDYHPHDAFWSKRGYVKRPDLVAELEWCEIGDNPDEKSHQLVFWLKSKLL